VIACPGDYSENLRLIDTLGELSGPAEDRRYAWLAGQLA